jgi:hypothetical protein
MENYYDHETGMWVTTGTRFEEILSQSRFHALKDGARDDPEAVWPLLLDLIVEVSDDLLACVGAGPLHDLIHYHTAPIIGRFEVQAAADPRFRKALFDILIAEGELEPDLEARLVRAAGPGFWLFPRVDEDSEE